MKKVVRSHVPIELFEDEVRLLRRCCQLYGKAIDDDLALIHESQSDFFEELLREQYKVRDLEDRLILLLDDFYK